MKKKFILASAFILGTGLWFVNSSLTFQSNSNKTLESSFLDLTLFNNPGKSWQVVGDLTADLDKDNVLTTSKGSGILVNIPTNKVKGEDLFTNAEFGDIELEFDYLMAKEGNSGIYFQGRYELQLEDSWSSKIITSSSNGGIYDIAAPRTNASKAPGLWQHLKVLFQAPRFDQDANKIENARMLRVELNGVLIQENVELFRPTLGAVSDNEVSKASLRIQGDHGAIAFRNLKIIDRSNVDTDQKQQDQRFSKDPILVEAPVTTILRSFIDLDNGIRVVHGVSVGSGKNLHYTYDMDYGMLVQLWRGDFLDATPMWDGRGNGTAIPLGAVQRFGKPTISMAKLLNPEVLWPTDTIGSQYKPKGYIIDEEGNPTFKYEIYGSSITDASKIINNGQGLSREIKVNNSNPLYFRLATADNILELTKGNFIIGDKEYYLQLDNPKKDKVFIREVDGGKELIVQFKDQFNYSIIL